MRKINIPDWCIVGNTFEWKAKEITGSKSTVEYIIGYTNDGFLHHGYNTPIYETKFNDLNSGCIVARTAYYKNIK